MKVKYLDLIAQYKGIEDDINKAVIDVLRSGSYCLGEPVIRFESQFAEYCVAKHAVACNSGTSALHMALLAAGVQPGDEVITTAGTFVATAAAIILAKAMPVIVDIDDATLNIDVTKVEAQITNRTKAIIAVHLHGNPCDLKEIRQVCQAYGLVLIEDAAQAHGSEYEGQIIGTYGDMACFSFYPGKSLGACGEAGAVTTNSSHYAEKLRLVRDWGSKERYLHEVEGYNYRMDAIQGAVLGVKLKHLPAWIDARVEKASIYHRLLSETPVRFTTVRPGMKHAHHVLAIRTSHRDYLKLFLSERGIDTGIHYPVPVHKQLAFAKRCRFDPSLPVSEIAANELLSLPIYPELSEDSIHYVCENIHEFFKVGGK